VSDSRSRKQTSQRTRASAETVFGTMANTGAKEYVRSRDLPGLISLWPAEIANVSTEGSCSFSASFGGRYARNGGGEVRLIGATI
jgi:hypothetical protein